jgi:hypothetical protein
MKERFTFTFKEARSIKKRQINQLNNETISKGGDLRDEEVDVLFSV